MSWSTIFIRKSNFLTCFLTKHCSQILEFNPINHQFEAALPFCLLNIWCSQRRWICLQNPRNTVVSTPLKNMSSSVGMIIPNIWKVIINSMVPVTTKQVTVFFPQNTETRVGGFAYCEASIEGPFVPNGFPKIRGFNRGFPRKPPSHHPPIRLACAHLHRASVKKRNRIDMNGNCAIWCPQQLWLAYKPNKESIKYISIYVYDLRCGSTVPFNLEVHSAITAWMAGQARRIIPAALRQWSGACPLQCRWSLSFAPWAAGIHSYTFWTAGNQRWQWRTSYKWRL